MNSPAINVLSLSDKVLDIIYTASIIDRYNDINIILGCGDLPYYYLEFVQDALNVPLFFVRGNHGHIVEHGDTGPKTAPLGGVDLHRKIVNYNGLILAGMEGSVRYKPGKFMYTQFDMWLIIIGLIPKLILNRIFHGRFLDVFVTHSPPWGIHDQEDWVHQGFKSFRWFLKVFKPAYHFHGHIHLYYGDEVTETRFLHTQVINTYGYKETHLDLGIRSPSSASKSSPIESLKN